MNLITPRETPALKFFIRTFVRIKNEKILFHRWVHVNNLFASHMAEKSSQAEELSFTVRHANMPSWKEAGINSFSPLPAAFRSSGASGQTPEP
jgi:hypothetical protein